MADDVTHVSQTTRMAMMVQTTTIPEDETMTSQKIPPTVLRFHYYWYHYCFGPTSSSIVGFDDPFLQVVDLFGVTALYYLRVVFEMTWYPSCLSRVVSDIFRIVSCYFDLPGYVDQSLEQIAWDKNLKKGRKRQRIEWLEQDIKWWNNESPRVL
jgi:hypothetical protein